MNKQKILETIAEALNELDKEPAHLILDLDVRSVSNEHTITEVHLHNGEVVFFHFYTRTYSDQQNRQRGTVAEMHSNTSSTHT